MSKSHCEPYEAVSRRQLLKTTILTSLSAGLALSFDANISRVFAMPPCQFDWAHCANCDTLFFNGDRKFKGRCAAFGVPATKPHVPVQSSDRKYYLAFDDSTGTGQGDWRFCGNCGELFFNGFPDHGVCPRDGKPHVAAGFNFFLFHDRRPDIQEEPGWRFCTKCKALFKESSNISGCPADGKRHNADGFHFVVGLKATCFEGCPPPHCA